MSDTEDDWLFVGPESDDYEPSQSYAPGGLCPVKLGDLVGPGTPLRYRIIFKLGFGSFSTVWLAHDSVEWLDVLPGEKTIWISSVLVETRKARGGARNRMSSSVSEPLILLRGRNLMLYSFWILFSTLVPMAFINPPPRTLLTPPFYAAPGIVFPQVALNKEDPPWDQRSDIWSLGVAVSLFPLYSVGAGGLFPELLFDDTELPHYMVCICGEVPDAWRDHIDSRPWPLDFAPDMTEEFWVGRKEHFAQLSVEDPPGLVRLMRRMLVLDLAKRPSAQEFLDDPYFSCSNGARNVVGSIHPLMQLPTGIPTAKLILRQIAPISRPRLLWILHMLKSFTFLGRRALVVMLRFNANSFCTFARKLTCSSRMVRSTDHLPGFFAWRNGLQLPTT
ncbi:hypothetical protein C8J57DRAFT_1465845 [Mycena rebaudengoi]|nr:hypothetical protein C8J57DRAFT_1465845 [Mycena rebaudengoi]